MTIENKTPEQITSETHEMLEKARHRIQQKKRLYYHFVLFLLGSLFLIVINKVLKVKQEWNWFVWVIIGWAFVLTLHVFNVWITDRFLGKEWEKKQREKLVAQQRAKIVKLEQEVSRQFPLPGAEKDHP